MSENQFPPTEPRLVPPTEPIGPAHSEPMQPARASKVIGRRTALALLATGGAAALLAAVRRGGGDSGTSTLASSDSTAAAATNVGRIPEETAGPYPGDGSNGPNVLTECGVVRSDIRSSFGSASGAADGVPLTLDLTVLDRRQLQDPLGRRRVPVALRPRRPVLDVLRRPSSTRTTSAACRSAGADGALRFTSIFPGAYAGRWPHVHFEVFEPRRGQRPSAGTPGSPHSWPSPRTVRRVYTSRATRTASPTSPGARSTCDMVFRDGFDLADAPRSPARSRRATPPA